MVNKDVYLITTLKYSLCDMFSDLNFNLSIVSNILKLNAVLTI